MKKIILIFIGLFVFSTVSADVSLLIRSGDKVIYDDNISYPVVGTIDVYDNEGNIHSINSRSVLGILHSTDQTDSSFSISDLQYYSSFGSFYLKCLTSNITGRICDDWQYAVNGNIPFTGIDQTIVSDDDSIGIFFGSNHRISFSTMNVSLNENLEVTVKEYNYLNNTWSPLSGVTIGVTTPDPNNPWSPTVLSEHPVDADGQVQISFNSAGNYDLGIKEDFYYPLYEIGVGLIKGGTILPPKKVFLNNDALSFLNDQQFEDGSFGKPMYSDWAAIAFASKGQSNKKLKNYLKENPLYSDIVTENERRAMALMSMGIDPYDGTEVNYIKKIIDSYDGNQFGNLFFYNDDIFALIVLKNAGYSYEDEIISKTINYVTSKQFPDGSWGSVDLTAAAIQALRNYNFMPGVESSISKAEDYLVNVQDLYYGFGNGYSSSWVIQAIYSNKNLSPLVENAEKYLAEIQLEDGGLQEENESMQNRIWLTSYAIPAMNHKKWNDVMFFFEKKYNPTENLTINEIKKTSSNFKSKDIKKELKKNLKTDYFLEEENFVEDKTPFPTYLLVFSAILLVISIPLYLRNLV